MKRWNPPRWAALIGGVVLGAVGIFAPAALPIVAPIAKFLIGTGAGLVGVAVRTPGHQPAPSSRRVEGPTLPG